MNNAVRPDTGILVYEFPCAQGSEGHLALVEAHVPSFGSVNYRRSCCHHLWELSDFGCLSSKQLRM